ncbi:hypothetical protein Tco_0747706, partial [Tanacetum coccineum]
IIDFLATSHTQYALTESPTIYVSLIEQFWQAASASILKNRDMEITATIDGKVKVVFEASIRRHLKLEDSDGISTLPTSKKFEQLALMGAPSTSQPPTSPPSMQKTHVAEEAANMPHDSPLLEGHTPGSDEGSMTLNELTVLLKKLEHKVKSRKYRRRAKIVISDNEDYQEDLSKQGRKIAQIDEDKGITLVQMSAQTQGRKEYDLEPDFEYTAPEEDYTAEPDISTANVPVSTVGPKVSTASPQVRTAAESLVYIRRSAAKRKDKGKAIMKEVEPVQKKTKLQLEQERLGLEEAPRLQEQLDEEERQRIARVQEKARTFNTEEWDNIQIEAELINERKRKFAQQRAEQRRNKPMTQAQQRTYMCNYIKHMGSHTLQQLKKLSFDKINELFEITMKRVNTFTLMESNDTVSKVVAGSSKRDAKQELNQESSKRQKIGEGSEPAEELKDKESDELSQEQLQQKIIRVGDHTKVYQFFEDMLQNFNRDELVKLWDLVRERFSLTEPTDDKERALWVELKRLFEPDTDDLLELQRYMHDPLTWRLYNTCGVHYVSTETGLNIFMLVEKDYPMTRGFPMLMLVNKLQVDQHSEMADELLRKVFILANRPRH